MMSLTFVLDGTLSLERVTEMGVKITIMIYYAAWLSRMWRRTWGI
jgi:hypothetical protein